MEKVLEELDANIEVDCGNILLSFFNEKVEVGADITLCSVEVLSTFKELNLASKSAKSNDADGFTVAAEKSNSVGWEIVPVDANCCGGGILWRIAFGVELFDNGLNNDEVFEDADVTL